MTIFEYRIVDFSTETAIAEIRAGLRRATLR